ncbi:hypothetical protein R6Q57_015462 [Mikania cordata]
MSTTIHFPPPPPPPPSSIPNAAHYYITNLGLGYAIAIAFGFLVLFSSLLLASYICLRHRHTRRNHNAGGVGVGGGSDNGIILPTIVFVDEHHNNEDQSVVGLDQSVINSYPKFPFSKGIPKPIDSLCAICLCEYRESEMMRMLPDCKHCFHLSCVDAWLKLNASCPVCRSSPLPTPLSTPLAEVVPLSQYSDGRRRSARQHMGLDTGDLVAECGCNAWVVGSELCVVAREGGVRGTGSALPLLDKGVKGGEGLTCDSSHGVKEEEKGKMGDGGVMNG